MRRFIESPAFIILMGALAAFDPLSIDTYLPAFPQIQKDLFTSYSNVELSLSAFFIGMALGQLVYGPLADRYGRKRPLLAGMLIYMLASVGCALSSHIFVLILFRILQAFGGCAGMVITRAVVRDLFDKKRAAHFFSSMVLIMGLAPILGPLLGGVIAQTFGWRMIFWFLSAANLICMICIAILLPETHFQREKGMTVSKVLKSYWSLLGESHFIGYVIPDAAIRAGMFAYIAGSPFVFIEIFHVAPVHYGWIFGSNALGLITASQINRLLLKSFDSEKILRFSIPIAALFGICLFVFPLIFDSPLALFVPLFLFIMTLGFVGPNSIACALAAQGHRAGKASALYGTLQWSVASFSSFFVSHFHNGTALPMTGVICACGLISVGAFTALVPKIPLLKV